VQELNTTLYLGFDDWRLPTRNEWQSLVNYSRVRPATTFPDTVVTGPYWSSTTSAYDMNGVWIVGLNDGSLEGHYDSSNDGSVRAVRGGPCWVDGDWCIYDSDCDDGVFCNGTETCVDSICQPGEVPCDNETPFCDEDNSMCLECLDAGDCDDGLYCTGDSVCTAGVCWETGNPCSGLTPFCNENNDLCAECLTDTDCSAADRCANNMCIARCTLAFKYKPPVSAKLKKAKKLKLKISGGAEFDPAGAIDAGHFSVVKGPKVNTKKGFVQITVLVPAGFPSGSVGIKVGECYGEIFIL
jgi:hypothetical protein